MKNKELLNKCYSFFNRFITADELIKELTNMDTSNLSKEDIKEQNKLIKGIKNIANDNPNEIDEYVIKEKESIKKSIKTLEDIPKDSRNNDFLKSQLENLKKDYKKVTDSYERWSLITKYINKNKYFNNVYKSLTDHELLEFIAQNIQAPFPPQMSQEKFEKLVKTGIKNDEREWLWRLAFNYENKNINFDSIVDFFIKKKDGYYLAELISAIGECLNIDDILCKINDKELIIELKNRKDLINNYVTEEQLNKLINKLD